MFTQPEMTRRVDEPHGRPSPIEFEMAYQARVAGDRIRFAIECIEQTMQRSELVCEVSLQLLDGSQSTRRVGPPLSNAVSNGPSIGKREWDQHRGMSKFTPISLTALIDWRTYIDGRQCRTPFQNTCCGYRRTHPFDCSGFGPMAAATNSDARCRKFI